MGTGSTIRQQSQDKPQLLGKLNEEQAIQPLHMHGGLGKYVQPLYALWWVVQPLGPPRVQASWLLFSCGVSIPFGFLNPSLNSSIKLPELNIMFGCRSLHLFLSAIKWSLSEDSYVRLMPVRITVALIVSGLIIARGMALNLDQSVVGHSLILCDIFVPAFPVGRINFGLKVVWVGWSPYSSTGSPAWL